MINTGITIVSTSFSIISFIYAIYCSYRLKKKEKEQKSITWEDVNIATKDLVKKIEKEFQPDVIYIPNVKSGLIVHFAKDYFSEYIPVILGQTILKKQYPKSSTEKIENQDDYLYFETNKWYAYIPKSLLPFKHKNLLIIDDFAMSGDFLEKLVNQLIDNGFAKNKIITSCLATTEVAIANKKSPTFYWKKFSTIDIYMPWGKPY